MFLVTGSNNNNSKFEQYFNSSAEADKKAKYLASIGFSVMVTRTETTSQGVNLWTMLQTQSLD